MKEIGRRILAIAVRTFKALAIIATLCAGTMRPAASTAAGTPDVGLGQSAEQSQAASTCVGDCNGDGSVTVDEIIAMVNIALGLLPSSACAAGDANQDGAITIDEILLAELGLFEGCACGFIGPRQCGGHCPNAGDVCQPLPDDSACACRSEFPSPTPTSTARFTPGCAGAVCTPTSTPAAPPTPTAAVLATFTPNPTPGCIEPPPGMVAWWTGDNSTADLSGNGNQASLHGSASYTGGVVGAAFSIPTTVDYVSAPNTASLNFSGSFSIDAWVRTLNAATGRATIVDKRVGPDPNPTGYHLFIFQGALGFQLADGQPFLNQVAPGPPINDGAWHHVAATLDRNSPTGGKLYVDGLPVLTFDPTTRPGSIVNAASLRLGVRGIGSPQTFENFQGAIDEVELFDRELGASEVQSLFAAGSGGKCKTPLPTRTASPTVTATPTATATPACGEPRSVLISTGNGPLGGYDSLWQLTGAPAGTTHFPPTHPAVVVSGYGSWTTLPNTDWVSADTICATSTGCPVGLYSYELCWEQCGELAGPTSFSALADNRASIVLDNNVLATVPGFTTPISFGFNTGPGFHSLRIDVANDPYFGTNIPTPTGLDLSGLLSGQLQIVACPVRPPTVTAVPTISTHTVKPTPSSSATPTRTATAASGTTLTVIKHTDPQGPQDFTFTVSGGLSPSTFSLDDDSDPTLPNSQTFTNIAAGTYTVTELSQSGWMITSIGCVGAAGVSTGANSATVTITQGANVTCTFWNAARPAPTSTRTATQARPPTATATSTPTRTSRIPPPD